MAEHFQKDASYPVTQWRVSTASTVDKAPRVRTSRPTNKHQTLGIMQWQLVQSVDAITDQRGPIPTMVPWYNKK